MPASPQPFQNVPDTQGTYSLALPSQARTFAGTLRQSEAHLYRPIVFDLARAVQASSEDDVVGEPFGGKQYALRSNHITIRRRILAHLIFKDRLLFLGQNY